MSHTIDTGSFKLRFQVNLSFVFIISFPVLNQLQETYLESVLIAIPHSSAQTTLNDVLPLWRVVEDYIDKQKILSAGVCDFMLPLLSDLCNSARVIH